MSAGWLSIACQECGSGPGWNCTGLGGRQRQTPHHARRKRAVLVKEMAARVDPESFLGQRVGIEQQDTK